MKLDPRSKKYNFLGYVDGTKCYHFYNIEKGSIIKNYNVKFIECDNFIQKKGISKIYIKLFLEVVLKTKPFAFIFDSENNNDIEGGLDHARSQ